MNRDHWDQQDHKLLCPCSCPATAACPCCSLKKEQTMQRTQGLWHVHVHKQLLLSAKLWGEKQTSQTNTPVFQGAAAAPPFCHVLAVQQGDKCQEQTWLSKHPTGWDICLHAGGPMAKLLLLVHLSIRQERSFLCTAPCVICWIKFFLISRPKPKKQTLEQTRFCANIIPTSAPGN